MKLLTHNFLTCAVKACKTSPASFPLHFKDVELEQNEIAYNEVFLRGVLGRVDWPALRTASSEVSHSSLKA
jgi:multifunctional methyltransferase subunit TRM112